MFLDKKVLFCSTSQFKLKEKKEINFSPELAKNFIMKLNNFNIIESNNAAKEKKYVYLLFDV
jgi:hypothetical protein